jgi:hypothetical protein
VTSAVDHRTDLASASTGNQGAVAEIMIHNPKTLSARASIAAVRAALDDDHVHMVLLTDGTTLVGTLVASDLPPAEGPALPWSRLTGRTVPPDYPVSDVLDLLNERETRRIAVVNTDHTLLGLVCLKARRTGFCSDGDVISRSQDRERDSRAEHPDVLTDMVARDAPIR